MVLTTALGAEIYDRDRRRLLAGPHPVTASARPLTTRGRFDGKQTSGALATVVGVLIEVPVMLSVVKIVNASKDWYDAGAAANQSM